jgi:DNA helicase-2/ATP-dependent DNA helicase PcrA
MMPGQVTGGGRPTGSGTGAGAPYAPRSARAKKQPVSQIAGLSTGDRVLHAKFGEGMVLGIEPGGIVRVFFSELGEQKRLLLEYAPLKRL